MDQIAERLWRWTAPHPAWKPGAEVDSPGDWDRDVGCLFYDTAESAVFIDPLVPTDAESFWSWADHRVGGRPVSVLTTIAWHARSRAAFVHRYHAAIPGPTIPVPDAVEAFGLEGAAETIFWLPEVRTLVPGDRILGGRDGGLRFCPESWLEYLPGHIGHADLKAMMQPLRSLDVERVLVSHGEPVLTDGGRALKALLGDA